MGIFAGLVSGAANEYTKNVNMQLKAQTDANAAVDAHYREQLNSINPEAQLYQRKKEIDLDEFNKKQAALKQQNADALKAASGSSGVGAPVTQPPIGKQFDFTGNADINNSNSTPSSGNNLGGSDMGGLFGAPSSGPNTLPPQVAAGGTTPESLADNKQLDTMNPSHISMTNLPPPQAGGQPDFMVPAQSNHFAAAQHAQDVASKLEASGLAKNNPFTEATVASLKTEAEMHYKAHEEEMKELERNAKPLESADGQKVGEAYAKDYNTALKTGTTQYNPVATIDGKRTELKQPLTNPTPEGKEAGEVDQHIHDTIASPLMQASAAARKGNGSQSIDVVYSTLKDKVNEATKNIVTFTSNDPRVTDTDKHDAATQFAGYLKTTFGQSLSARIEADPNLQEVLNPETMKSFNASFTGKTIANPPAIKDTTQAEYNALQPGSTYTVGGITYTKKAITNAKPVQP